MKKLLFLSLLFFVAFAMEQLTFSTDLGGAAPAKTFSVKLRGPTGGCLTYAPLGTNSAASGSWDVTVTGTAPDSLQWTLVGIEKPDSGNKPGFIYLAIQACGENASQFTVSGVSR